MTTVRRFSDYDIGAEVFIVAEGEWEERVMLSHHLLARSRTTRIGLGPVWRAVDRVREFHALVREDRDF